jgi:hypothetical protein
VKLDPVTTGEVGAVEVTRIDSGGRPRKLLGVEAATLCPPVHARCGCGGRGSNHAPVERMRNSVGERTLARKQENRLGRV